MMFTYLEGQLAVVLLHKTRKVSNKLGTERVRAHAWRILYCSAPVAFATFFTAGPMSAKYSSGISSKVFAWSIGIHRLP